MKYLPKIIHKTIQTITGNTQSTTTSSAPISRTLPKVPVNLAALHLAETQMLIHLLEIPESAFVNKEKILSLPSQPTLFIFKLQNQTTQIQIGITENCDKAYIKQPPAISAKNLMALLKSHHIMGLEYGTLERLITTSKKASSQTIWHLISSAVLPQTPLAENIDFSFPLEQAQPFFKTLATSTTDLIPASTRAVWAYPGQILGIRRKLSPSNAGSDIFGRPLIANIEPYGQLQAGPGVCLTEDSGTFEAMAYGYVFIDQNRLQLRDPLTVTEDHSSAHFLYIPSLDMSNKNTFDLGTILALKGIQAGIDTSACQSLEEYFATANAHPQNICLAQGMPAHQGRDAKINWFIDCTKKPGRFQSDGSIDFRDTNFGLKVEMGTLLATKEMAIAGTSGFTIMGETLEVSDGQDITLESGVNIDVATEDQVLHFRSALDGRVHLNKHTLQVFETLTIEKDVDYRSGHIDFPGNVIIKGSVLPEFIVKARGNIAIQQQIEAGAKIEAGGDLIVSGGIIGHRTYIQTQGSIKARFIQEATVIAKGDITIGAHLFKPIIRTTGQVTVKRGQGRLSGLIAGGQVLAAKGIKAHFAGSPNGTRTELIVGIDPLAANALDQCENQLDQCRKGLLRLQNLLGLEEINLVSLRNLLSRAAPGNRAQLRLNIRAWHQKKQEAAIISARRNELSEALIEPAMKAELVIDQTTYPGVTVQVGKHRGSVQWEMSQVKLSNTNWGQVDAGALQSAA